MNLNPTTSTVDDGIAISQDKRNVAAQHPHRIKLEKALDMSNYIKEVERLLTQPIKIPGNHITNPISLQKGRPPSIFTVNSIWHSSESRKAQVAKLYNFGNIRGREWMKDLLLEESDSEDDLEPSYTQRDVRNMLKIHKMRRDLQRHQGERSGSQYTYYSSGLLSATDPYPEPPIVRSRAPSQVAPSSSKSEAGSANYPPSATGSNASIDSTSDDLDDSVAEPLSVDPNNSAIIPISPLSN